MSEYTVIEGRDGMVYGKFHESVCNDVRINGIDYVRSPVKLCEDYYGRNRIVYRCVKIEEVHRKIRDYLIKKGKGTSLLKIAVSEGLRIQYTVPVCYLKFAMRWLYSHVSFLPDDVDGLETLESIGFYVPQTKEPEPVMVMWIGHPQSGHFVLIDPDIGLCCGCDSEGVE